jgi:hypothetical protein
MKKLLNKNVIYFVLIILLSGCKTLDFATLKPDTNPISPKILGLNLIEENLGVDERQIIEEELFSNLSEAYGPRYGYLKLKYSNLEIKTGQGFLWVGAFLGFIPNLFGFPMMTPSVEADYTFEILNSNKELVGKYTAYGYGKSKIALYHGYTIENASRKATSDAILMALPEIREKIQAEADQINKALTEAGKINSNSSGV